MNDLALLYQMQSRFPDAEAMLKRALKAYEDATGAESAGAGLALHNLGLLYLRQKQFADAQRSLNRALAVREKAFGRHHPALAETIEALAAATEPENVAQATQLRARPGNPRRRCQELIRAALTFRSSKRIGVSA
jgi:tetratricopeptide (TPR) repeat protein